MSTNEVTECFECGGSEFQLSSGFYYCNQCQTQSQTTQEICLDAFEMSTGTKVYKKRKQAREKKEKLPIKSAGNMKLVITEKCRIIQALLREQIDWLESEGHVVKDTFRERCRDIWFQFLKAQNIHDKDYTKWKHQMEPKFLPAILYLGGVYSGSGLCMFQMCQWLRNGDLPYYKEFYAKRSVTPCGYITFCNPLPYFINSAVTQLLTLMRIKPPELIPRPEPIISALLHHLCLPLCLQKYVERLLYIILRSNKAYLSTVCQDYTHSNESHMLSLIICLLRIFYCLDGEEECSMERTWDTDMGVRYLKNVDEECDYIYLWSDWVKLYTLEVLVRHEFKYSTEVSIFPEVCKQAPILDTSDSLFRHLLATELAIYDRKTDPISIDIIDIFWKALKNQRKRVGVKESICATHGSIERTQLSIIRDMRNNFTPRAIKLDAYFKENLSKRDFAILIYKIRNMASFDSDLIPEGFHFILEVSSEMLGLLEYQLFEIVTETMMSLVESSNSVLINNPV